MTFVDTSQLKIKEPLPGWKGRYFHTDNITFAYSWSTLACGIRS